MSKVDLISLIIINYNNKSYLKRCINSILNQSYKNLEIIFIDNESKDNSFDYMKEEYSNEDILLIRNNSNNGYTGAANQGIKISHGKYVMILNPDIIMEPDFIEKMYNCIDKDYSIGAVSGKLLKYDFENNKKLNYIDSTGIIMFKSTRCVDRGQNEEDVGQYNKVEQIFAVCGAAPLYRRVALEMIKIDDEYFDEDFFCYKEDIDLSWRLNIAGYKNMYNYEAIAYHGRAVSIGKKEGIFKLIAEKKNQSKFLRGISVRNHIMMVYKNDVNGFTNKYRRSILKRRLKLSIYYLFFERFNFTYYIEGKKKKKHMIMKRNKLMNKIHNASDISELIIDN